jgi:hypothetical protein
MEVRPLLPPAIESPPPLDKKKESRKRKKNKAESIGSLVVETEPKQRIIPEKHKDKTLQVHQAESLWQHINEHDKLQKKTATPKGTEKKLDQIQTTPEAEAEAPLQQLSHVEALTVNQALAKDRSEALNQESPLSGDDAIQKEQSEVAKAYLNLVEEIGDPDVAMQTIAEQHDLPIDEIHAEIQAGLDDEPEIEATEPVEPGSIDIDDPLEHEVPLYDVADEEIPDEDATAGSGGQAGNPPSPPTPPVPPSGSGGHATGGHGGFVPPVPIPGGGTSPSSLSPQSMMTPSYPRGLLVGGIVGYLVGRRRGRIKAERTMRPVQKRLEKQVKGLQKTLIAQEYALRKSVAKRAALEKAVIVTGAVSEQITRRPLERSNAPHAEQLHATPMVRSERIGKVLVAAEARPNKNVHTEAPAPIITKSETKRVEQVDVIQLAKKGEQSPHPQEPLTTERRVALLSRTDLLAVSETVAVEGTTLRKLFEGHMIGEQGLRRLVSEHLNGKDIQQTLRRELVEREIDFERDPQLRDRAGASITGGGKSAVSSLLSQAVSFGAQAAQQRPQANKTASENTKKEVVRKPERLNTADISLVGVIVILLGLIIYFVATHQ